MNRQPSLDRRSFLRTAASTALAGTALAATALPTLTADRAAAAADDKKRVFKKAVKYGMVGTKQSMLDKFKLLKSLGFDGVELSAPNGPSRDEVLRARDESGLPVHGVVFSQGWRAPYSNKIAPLSAPDPAVRKQGVEALKTALRDSKAYGGTSVLVVAGKVTENESYDQVYQRTHESIRQAVPEAEKLGIKMLIENVWNNFLLSPLEMAEFIDKFDSRNVGVYFDVGNVVRYGWPEQWIRILGKRIGKLDIKEYSRKKQQNEGLWKGFKVKLLEGDCNWPAVMTALREINYTGWGTAEVPGGGSDRLQEISERMDRILAS